MVRNVTICRERKHSKVALFFGFTGNEECLKFRKTNPIYPSTREKESYILKTTECECADFGAFISAGFEHTAGRSTRACWLAGVVSVSFSSFAATAGTGIAHNYTVKTKSMK